MPRDKEKIRVRMKEYNARPEQRKDRGARVAARRIMEKAGIVKKGDGLDVDHKVELRKGGTNARSNLVAVPMAKNRAVKGPPVKKRRPRSPRASR